MRLLPAMLILLALAPALPAATKAAAASAKAPDTVSASGNPRAGAASAVAVLDIDAWLATRANALAIKERSYDPFKRSKDPSKVSAPPVAPVSAPGSTDEELLDEPSEDPALVFNKAVGLIKVSMVGNGMFVLSGGQTMRTGQEFVLSTGGQKIKAKVHSVSQKEIVLENLDGGQKASIPMSSLPAGMQRAGDASSVPGMMPRRSEGQPVLELDR